ncbi:MAG: HAD family hydrolase [Planctomycetota bacterium]
MDVIAQIRTASSALKPRPTETEAVLRPVPGIRVVLWDIYGTLLISASGDVGSADAQGRGTAMHQALRSIGLRPSGAPHAAAEQLLAAIKRFQHEVGMQGVPAPEVEIRQCWRDCCARLLALGLLDSLPREQDLAPLALAYELASNPCWPMPDARRVLSALQRAGLRQGIISNAQFYTPLLFPALFRAEIPDLGIDPELCWFSYEHLRAKPDTWLFRQALERLAHRGIGAQQCLYIGNDMRNDMLPASQMGLRTALFAGDARSLRWRREHPQASTVQPDLVLTCLSQLPDCILDHPVATKEHV